MPNSLQSKVKYYVLALYLSISFSAIGQEVSGPHKAADKSSLSEVWEQAMVNTAGSNTMGGIEVFYKRVICNSTEHVLLKFVNTNSEEVLIEWADGIYMEDKEWIMNERNDKSRELRLAGKGQIEGDCEDRAGKILRFDVNDYYTGETGKSFRFAPSYLDITKTGSIKK